MVIYRLYVMGMIRFLVYFTLEFFHSLQIVVYIKKIHNFGATIREDNYLSNTPENSQISR